MGVYNYVYENDKFSVYLIICIKYKIQFKFIHVKVKLMRPPDTVSLPVRVSKLVLELVDQQAARKNISRSAWLRDAILAQLQHDQQQLDLERLEQRLLERLDALQTVIVNKVNAHVTAEIDSLTQG